MATITGTGGADTVSNTDTPSIFLVEYIDIDGGTNNLEARTLDTYFDTTDGSIDVVSGDTAPSGANLLVNPFGTADSNDIDPEIQKFNTGNGGIGFDDSSGSQTLQKYAASKALDQAETFKTIKIVIKSRS